MRGQRSPRAKPTSIRRQISALLWIAILPLAAVSIWSTYAEYRLTLANSSEAALGLASSVATSTEQLLTIAESQMLRMAERQAPQLIDPALCGIHARAMQDVLSYLHAVAVQDTVGNPICWTLDAPLDADVNVADRPWFKAAREHPGMAIGNPVVGPITGEWIVALAVRLNRPDGSFAGTLMGSLPLSRFQELLGGVEVGEDELITVVTMDRLVVARSDEHDAYVGREVPPNQYEDREVAPDRYLSEGDDFQGLRRTWARIDLPRIGWQVHAGIPYSRIQGPAIAVGLQRAGLNALIVVALVLLIMSMHRRILGPLAGLADGVQAVSEGRPVSLPAGAPVEVAAVVDTLNSTLAERERAEAAEREATSRFRSIVDNAVLGISLTTEEGRFLEVNPALVEMTGYDSAEDLMATGAHALYRSAADRERLVETYRAATSVTDLECDWVRKDGRPIVVRLNGNVTRSPDYGVVFETMVEDITLSRALDEQLRQAQKMEAVGRLAGGIAHDFNNILTVISGNNNLLLAQVADGDSMRVELEEIAVAARRGESLTAQLLDFGRSDGAETGIVCLNAIVDGLDKMLSRLLRDSVRIETRLGRNAPAVRANKGQLEQVLVNLVVNARDALPEGGRIGIETRAGTRPPTMEGAPDTEGVYVAVTDDGIGMDEETRRRIFEPFFTTKPRGEGSGLGLATAYGILSRMGGHISVTSEPGEGSRFEIWLPAAESPTGATRIESSDGARARAADRGESGGESILVVEDEAAIRRILERVLSHAGYEVLLARDGQEAITLAGDPETVIDLVVTDVVMPRVQGTEVAAHFAETRPDTPVLFISGHTFDLPIQERSANDPESFLPKPFSPDEIRARVRLLLDRRAVRPVN